MAKKKVRLLPGYRAPRSIAEARFWDSYKPDYRKWGAKRKRLTIDEAAALVMGLDPTSVEFMADEKNLTLARFEATKECLLELEQMVGVPPDSVLAISVMALDSGTPGLRVPAELTDAADLAGEGLLNREELVAKLERQIDRLQSLVNRQKDVIATMVVDQRSRSKKRAPSAITRIATTDDKLIVALLAKCIGQEYEQLFIRFKNDRYTSLVTTAKQALELLGWGADEDTIKRRIAAALAQWQPLLRKRTAQENQ